MTLISQQIAIYQWLNMSKHYVKQHLTYSMIPLDSNRKIPLICELLNVRSNLISIDNFDYLELNELICLLCTD